MKVVATLRMPAIKNVVHLDPALIQVVGQKDHCHHYLDPALLSRGDGPVPPHPQQHEQTSYPRHDPQPP